MLHEVIEALNIKMDGFYVDCTFGRGGHSRAILHKLGKRGRLLSFDKDQDASVAVEQGWLLNEGQFELIQGSYCMLSTSLDARDVRGKVDGILLDLGVSSPQLDDPRRGFSFQQDGVLDMRMDTSVGLTAKDWLNSAAEREIADIIFHYGEERLAKRIARRIVTERRSSPILTTQQLARLVVSVYPRVPRRRAIHPATKTFQAIRIHINNELLELKQVLEQVVDALAPAGRLVVLSFHSLEDRLVKRFVRSEGHGRSYPIDIPICDYQLKPRLKSLGKPVRPSHTEVEENPRARSAIMRTAERIG